MAQNLNNEFEGKIEKESLSQLVSIVENAQDAIISKNFDDVITSWNGGAVKMFGYSAQEAIGKTAASIIIPPEKVGEALEILNKIKTGEIVSDFDTVRLRKDGSRINVSIIISPVYSGNKIIGVSVVQRDITKRKWYENRIERIARLYSSLSKGNQLIIHCDNEDELFRGICNILVQYGGFVMVWIGFVDTKTKDVKPFYMFGSGTSYLNDIQISIDENSPFGKGPTGTAIRENRPVWSQDFKNDPITEPWHERAKNVGWSASASLPLLKKDTPIGSINLYSDIGYVFDDETKKLLIEIVEDINFALDSFVNKAKLKEKEEVLLKTQMIVEHSIDSIIGENLDGIITSWNGGAVKMFGYHPTEVLGKNISFMFPPEIKDESSELLNKIKEGEVFSDYDTVRLRKDGSTISVSLSASPVYSGDGTIVGASVVERDISERKELEDELLKASTDRYKALFISSRDAVMTLEPPSWKFTSANPATIEMFRAKSEGDFLYHEPWVFSPELQPDGRRSDEKAKEMIEKAMIKGSNLFEWTHKRLDGEEFPAEVLLSKVEMNGNTFLHAVVRDVTENKRVEKKLEEYSEEKFKVIFDNAIDGILIADIATKHFYIGNPTISKMLGYTPEEIKKLGVSDIHPKEDLSHIIEIFEKQTKGDTTTAKDLRVKRKDGSIFYCDITSSLIILAGRRYLLGIFRDTTERKNKEEILLKDEENLKEAQRIGHFGYFDWDTETFTMTWSDEYYRIHGLEPKGKTPSYEEHLKMYTPKSSALFDISVKKCLETGESFEIDMEQIRSDGTKIWTTVRGEAKRDKDNKIIGLHGTAQDITEKKKIEFEREQFLKFFVLSGDIMVIADPNGAFKKVNHSCLKLLGYSEEDLLSKPFISFVSPEDKQSTLDEMARQIKKGSSLNFENHYIRKDGTLILLSWNATYDKNTGITYATARDITEQKENQQHIKELNEVRHKFLEIISHQLRTPLTSVNWNLEAILDGDFGKLEDTTRRFLQFTHKASVEITQRIHDLLSAMDIEEGRMRLDKEEIALDSLVMSVAGQMKIKCEFKNISYQYIPPEKALLSMDLDTGKIRIAISKIIENAITYTKENGKIFINLKQVGNNIHFEVSDNGIGIPESEQHNIFSRFFRASNASVMQTDAFGIGLFIAKAFIEQHGGTIGFKSKEGEGSTFWFELPIKQSI